jgi:hypothetical protein
MSWHFSQALEEEYKAGNSLDGAQFVLWKSTPSALDDSCSGKMKDTWHRSPFGMMFVPSMDTLGGELLTWFRAVSPAKIFRLPEPVQDLTAPGRDSGWKWPESSVRYDPFSASWKIRQCSLLGDSDEFSETWPAWGTMRNGECWARQMWERRTKETEYGLWPTPNVPNGGRSVAHVTDWRGKSAYFNGKKVQVGLEAAVKMYPIPAARDYRSPNKKPYSERGGGKKGEQLPNAIGGPLNPPWVEWLMGWQIGWTGCEPLETDKCHSALLRHG